jgi:hypothetical protein
MGIGLPIPPEPEEIKRFIREHRMRLQSEPDIDLDSLAVWYLNRLPSYLWGVWKKDLEDRGYTWQRFVKILRYATSDVIEWALYDNLEWEDLVYRLIKLLERYAPIKG